MAVCYLLHHHFPVICFLFGSTPSVAFHWIEIFQPSFVPLGLGVVFNRIKRLDYLESRLTPWAKIAKICYFYKFFFILDRIWKKKLIPKKVEFVSIDKSKRNNDMYYECKTTCFEWDDNNMCIWLFNSEAPMSYQIKVHTILNNVYKQKYRFIRRAM